MKKTLSTTRKRGDVLDIDGTSIEFVDCERGRVRVRIVHEEAVRVEVKARGNKALQSESASV